jgi:penicillin-binding protein 1B
MQGSIDRPSGSQGDSLKRDRSGSVILLVLATLTVLGLLTSLVFSFRQLEKAFLEPSTFIPTRLYSDLTRISPPMSRGILRVRLERLGYRYQEKPEALSFTLRPIQYPTYLLPDDHPTLKSTGKEVNLAFDGEGDSALLGSVEVEGQEVSELYLEPELVATFSPDGASDGKNQIREFVPFSEIPAQLWQAIIAVEDQHFLEHKGFDPRGLARAVWVNLKTLSLAQGGSTLTQQLVKNLMVRRGKNLFRKAGEFFLSLALEVKYDKEKILERYLNEVYLGQVGNLEVHGVAEGAKHFFGKRLSDLNLGECALLAGLIRGPGFYSPYRHLDRALERRTLVLKKMVETGQIVEQEAQLAVAETVHLAPPVSRATQAPYFTDFVKAELVSRLKDRFAESEIAAAGLRVYTTLDPILNTHAQKAVTDGVQAATQLIGLPEGARLEGALAAVDPTNGRIRALVGGADYRRSTFNRILNMRRQVGSTFKPIVYLAAFESGKDGSGVPYSPAYPMEDAAWKLTFDRGLQTWEPRNYDKEFLGWIPLRTALAHSVNTVTAKLGMQVGLGTVAATARALGVEQPLKEVPSLSLGVTELSPVELLRAYAAMANHGLLHEFTVIRAITEDDGAQYARFVENPKQVVSPAGADLITNVLRDVFTEGTARSAATQGWERPAAGKTGTTSHHRDAWFAGYTPQLTSVVWLGQDQDPAQGSNKKGPTGKLTGANAALPIWTRFMKNALEGEPPLVFPLSPNLKTARIDRFTGKRAEEDCPDPQVLVTLLSPSREPSAESCELRWPPSTRETTAP